MKSIKSGPKVKNSLLIYVGWYLVVDVTETRNVIPSLEFKTCMTIKS